MWTTLLSRSSDIFSKMTKSKSSGWIIYLLATLVQNIVKPMAFAERDKVGRVMFTKCTSLKSTGEYLTQN